MEQHLIPTFIKSEEKKVSSFTDSCISKYGFIYSKQPTRKPLAKGDTWMTFTTIFLWHSLMFDITQKTINMKVKPENQKFKLLFIFEYPQVKITVSGTISGSSLLRLSHNYKTEISTVFSEWQELFCYLLFFCYPSTVEYNFISKLKVQKCMPSLIFQKAVQQVGLSLCQADSGPWDLCWPLHLFSEK